MQLDIEFDSSLIALQDMSIRELIEYSNKSEPHLRKVKNMKLKRDVSFRVLTNGCHGIQILENQSGNEDDNGYEVVVLKHSDMPQNGRCYQINFNGHQLAGWYGKHELVLYHKNVAEGFKLIAKFLSMLFHNPPVSALEVGEGSSSDRTVIMDWLKTYGSSVPSLEILYNVNLTPIDLSSILDNIKATTALSIHNPLKNIPKTFRHSLPPLLKHFTCFNSKWIMLKQLVTPYFEFVHLNKTAFTNEHMAWYVEMCLDQAMPGLVYFEVDVEGMNLEKIAKGVKAEKTESKVYELLECTRYTIQNIIITGHYDFERDDGMIVTIGHRYGGYAHPSFQMFVWSKYDVKKC